MFTPEFLDKDAGVSGIDSETPIFVVGMVRSGTTLVEQILASHPPGVRPAGERKEIDQLATTLHEQLKTTEVYPANIGRLDPGPATACLAYGYLQTPGPGGRGRQPHRRQDAAQPALAHLGLIAIFVPCGRTSFTAAVIPWNTSARRRFFQNFKWMPLAPPAWTTSPSTIAITSG